MANDGRTTASSANDDNRDEGHPVALLDDMRRELERAADDLERATQQLHQRTGLVEHLEVLVDELLGLLVVPVVLVDENARVTALSRGASDMFEVDDPAAVVGKTVSSVLPAPVSKEVTAHVRAAGAAAGRTIDEGTGGPRRRGGGETAKTVRFVDLPSGSTLVVLGP